MTRNEAIAILVTETERGKAIADRLVKPLARRCYLTAYEDASRNLLRSLANAGAFEDGRNLDDRMPSRTAGTDP